MIDLELLTKLLFLCATKSNIIAIHDCSYNINCNHERLHLKKRKNLIYIKVKTFIKLLQPEIFQRCEEQNSNWRIRRRRLVYSCSFFYEENNAITILLFYTCKPYKASCLSCFSMNITSNSLEFFWNFLTAIMNWFQLPIHFFNSSMPQYLPK
jgi:hypothetical protein